MPGLGTGVLLILPAGVWLLVRSVEAGGMTVGRIAAAAAVWIAVQAVLLPVLFRIGRRRNGPGSENRSQIK